MNGVINEAINGTLWRRERYLANWWASKAAKVRVRESRKQRGYGDSTDGGGDSAWGGGHNDTTTQ